MFDKLFMLEGKIRNGAMSNCYNKNFGSLKANLTLKIKVKVTSILMSSIHVSSFKVKFKTIQKLISDQLRYKGRD